MDLSSHTPKHSPALRLIFPDQSPSLFEAQARRAVADENRHAADLASSDGDLRKIFALRASQMLEGGRAAIMPPESRRMLVGEARRFGLRAFEANLIIAIVQDGARRGQSPVSAATAELIGVIPTQRRREAKQLLAQRLIVAALMGVGLLTILIRWISG
ncbi:MAG: hypothetical protein JNK58_03910 [Phycisphaerae bacterium]|nr:hypothetical protein [Phycisphaerae bacterium]